MPADQKTLADKSRWLNLAASAARWMPDWMKRAVYRFPPLARFLRRRLNQAAPTGIQTVTIAAGPLAGMRMALDLQSEKYYWLGTYEAELQQAAAEWIKPGWVVYDVGANIGYVSLVFARLAGDVGQVYAFEALPENVKRLRGNLELNPGIRNVAVISAAVIDQTHPVQFWLGPSDKMGKAQGSAEQEIHPQQIAINVEGISLDEYVYQHALPSPQLIKLDIEGGEVLALPGMRWLLGEARPVLFLELHGEESCKTAWTLLKPLGYTLRYMKAGYPEVTSVEELGRKAYLVAAP
jgi:FkbM family methyltransferase